MYGLINIAAKELIIESFGATVWSAVCEQAELADDEFLAMQEYPDDVTYRIVNAAAHVLGKPAAELLKAFGEYWTRFIAARGYSELLELSGDSLVPLLENLDNMHAQVGLSFPRLRPPSFRVSDVTEGSLLLHYHSQRPGLAPMIIGLLQGLEAHFKTHIVVEQVASKGADADHDIFKVSYTAR